MDEKTKHAKDWLDKRYSKKRDGVYFAHQPIYGYESVHSEPNAILRLARTYHILKILKTLNFENFIDIGGGEGYIASIVRDLFGVTACSTDLSAEASYRAKEIFGIRSFGADAAQLPFPDKSYDVVLCSEVIEHLSRPVMVLSELFRIARKYVIVTTSEFCPLGNTERALRLCQLDEDYPHTEQNWFTKNDFEVLFGDKIIVSSQVNNLGGRMVEFFANAKLSRPQVERALDYLTKSDSLDANHDGVIVIVPVGGEMPGRSNTGQDAEPAGEKQEIFERILRPVAAPESQGAAPIAPDTALLLGLMCLSCNEILELGEDELVCQNCKSVYPIRNGVPLLYQETASASPPRDPLTRAISILANGQEERKRTIELLTKKLHKEVPFYPYRVSPRIATLLLRLLWLVKRPGSAGTKVKRIVQRLRNAPPDEILVLRKIL